MSVNRYRDHLFVLPEDDKNHELAHGFSSHFAVAARVMQVLPSAGGWPKVRGRFQSAHIRDMEKFPLCRMILLVDFDEHQDRFQAMWQDVPVALHNRVFVIGTWSEPERLRIAAGKGLEDIGRDLAQDCLDQMQTAWTHPLLQHNGNELARMLQTLRPFLLNQGETA